MTCIIYFLYVVHSEGLSCSEMDLCQMVFWFLAPFDTKNVDRDSVGISKENRAGFSVIKILYKSRNML